MDADLQNKIIEKLKNTAKKWNMSFDMEELSKLYFNE